jgi:hypothetical protein
MMTAMMFAPVYAYGMWNYDSESGDYTTADVGVAGNYNMGKLYSPAAYARATVDEDLPAGTTLRLQYLFEWEDLNHETHIESGIISSSGNEAGDWIEVEPDLPSVVYYIVAEARAGYGVGSSITWDTEWAIASLPFL